MPTLQKVQAVWSGFAGANGFSNFYFDGGLDPLPPLRAFFDAVKAHLPTTVDINIPNSGDQVDDVTGSLVGAWSAGAVAVVSGTGAGTYAAPSGLGVNWATTSVINGRRLKGRTYLVPLVGSSYEADGTLSPTVRSVVLAAATAFITAMAGELVTWHRPVNGAGGSSDPVTSATVPDKVYVLTSRRD